MFKNINDESNYWTSLFISKQFEDYLFELFGQSISKFPVYEIFWCSSDLYYEGKISYFAEELLHFINNILEVIQSIIKSSIFSNLFQDFIYDIIALLINNFNFEETKMNYFYSLKNLSSLFDKISNGLQEIIFCFSNFVFNNYTLTLEKNEIHSNKEENENLSKPKILEGEVYLFKSTPKNFCFSYLDNFSVDYFQKDFFKTNNYKKKDDFTTIWRYIIVNQMDNTTTKLENLNRLSDKNFIEVHDKYIETKQKIIQIKISRLRKFLHQNKKEIIDFYTIEKFLNENLDLEIDKILNLNDSLEIIEKLGKFQLNLKEY